jgi:hypothetical protein
MLQEQQQTTEEVPPAWVPGENEEERNQSSLPKLLASTIFNATPAKPVSTRRRRTKIRPPGVSTFLKSRSITLKQGSSGVRLLEVSTICGEEVICSSLQPIYPARPQSVRDLGTESYGTKWVMAKISARDHSNPDSPESSHRTRK